MLTPAIPKIMIDSRKLGDGGIGAYIENLVDGLLMLREDGEIQIELTLLVEETLLGSPEERRRVLRQHVRAARERWDDKVRFVAERSGKYSLGEYLRLASRQRVELKAHHVFHAPHYTLPLFIQIPTVATIHDVIHLSHPSSRYHEPVARTLLRSTVKRANRIITVSQHSRDVMLKELPIRSDRITVIGNAVRPAIAPQSPKDVAEFLSEQKIEKEYCLYVGSEMPHKGFTELLEAWEELYADVSDATYPHLYVVGRSFTEQSRARVVEMGLEEVVHFCGEVSDRRLALLYCGARAVVIPSREEGFGLPAIEAMNCGVPVVSTPLPSIREIGEGVVWFSADFEPKSFARALRRALGELPREILRIEKGKRKAAEFNLRDTSRATWKVYTQLIEAGAEHHTRRFRFQRFREQA